MQVETNPQAAEELKIRREKRAQKNRQDKQRREERMAQDSEYAEVFRKKNDERNKARTSRCKAERSLDRTNQSRFGSGRRTGSHQGKTACC